MIVRDRQLVVRREMDRRGISLKAVALDSGIPYATIVSYFPGERDRQPATIPGSALFVLVQSQALPLDLVSLLLPEGFQVVRVPEGIDFDDMEDLCRDFIATKAQAHHRDSPAGRELSDCEQTALCGKAGHLRAVGSAGGSLQLRQYRVARRGNAG
ncbi:hypothetical protein AB5I41_31100 [Sphingomonas sp. MMS24-JH45]